MKNTQMSSWFERWTPSLLPAAMIALVVSGAVACGGGGPAEGPGAPGPTPTQEEAAAAEAAAEAERQLEERRGELRQAREDLERMRQQADSGLPGDDPELAQTLDELEQAAAAAEARLAEDGARDALDRVERLEEEASRRLEELRAAEQQARQELRETYRQQVEEAPELPPDLVRGLDGERYLGYLPSALERVQRELQDEGYYDGPVHGELDQDTQIAIARFQQRNGLYVSGIPSPYTRMELFG